MLCRPARRKGKIPLRIADVMVPAEVSGVLGMQRLRP